MRSSHVFRARKKNDEVEFNPIEGGSAEGPWVDDVKTFSKKTGTSLVAPSRQDSPIPVACGNSRLGIEKVHRTAASSAAPIGQSHHFG
jgi:hypothetical protein